MQLFIYLSIYPREKGGTTALWLVPTPRYDLEGACERVNERGRGAAGLQPGHPQLEARNVSSCYPLCDFDCASLYNTEEHEETEK